MKLKPRCFKPGLLLLQGERSISAPAPETATSSYASYVQDSWPQFNPSNSSVMVLGSNEVQLNSLIVNMERSSVDLLDLPRESTPVEKPRLATSYPGHSGADYIHYNLDCASYQLMIMVKMIRSGRLSWWLII